MVGGDVERKYREWELRLKERSGGNVGCQSRGQVRGPVRSVLLTI